MDDNDSTLTTYKAQDSRDPQAHQPQHRGLQYTCNRLVISRFLELWNVPCASATMTSHVDLRALEMRGKLQCQHHLCSSLQNLHLQGIYTMEGPVLPMLTLGDRIRNMISTSKSSRESRRGECFQCSLFVISRIRNTIHNSKTLQGINTKER